MAELVIKARGNDKKGLPMESIRVLEKTGKDGTLSLHIPLGEPDLECEVVVTVLPKGDSRGWPPGYFDLAGSITDETFVRPNQGELPRPIELE